MRERVVGHPKQLIQWLLNNQKPITLSLEISEPAQYLCAEPTCLLEKGTPPSTLIQSSSVILFSESNLKHVCSISSFFNDNVSVMYFTDEPLLTWNSTLLNWFSTKAVLSIFGKNATKSPQGPRNSPAKSHPMVFLLLLNANTPLTMGNSIQNSWYSKKFSLT